MVAIAQWRLEPGAADPWSAVAAYASAWAHSQGVALRDAIVLVPFAQHLPWARRAWAHQGGWPPRIETTMTLARSCAPPAPGEAGQISFDVALDRLAARRLLLGQAWGEAWERRDARGFEHAVNAVVRTAQALARAAAAVAPEGRTAYVAQCRELLGAAAGPGGTERLLARVAFEWAAASGPAPTDVLFDLAPSAWIVVQAGGPDALAHALLSSAGEIPSLCIDTDVATDDPFTAPVAQARVAIAACADFEAEAQRTAAEVLSLLNQGRQPVALVAQDRLLMRRVRALLARQQVPLVDETGWKLSTTRAGAAIVSLLRAADPRARSDDWLDWLKTCVGTWPRRPDAPWSLRTMEGAMRRHGWLSPSAIDASQLPDAAAAFWHEAQSVVAVLADVPRRRSFAAWRHALTEALERCGTWSRLQADDAGRQALAAVHLPDAPFALAGDAGDAMPFDEFVAWIDDALEDASFIPEPPLATSDAPVVITPLARAMLRPFAAVVLPGCDEKRLGADPPPHPLLSDALASALGLESSQAQRERETLAFAQLLRVPDLRLLRRLDDGGEPLSASPLVERLRLAMLRAGRGDLPALDAPLVVHHVTASPVPRPAPRAPDMLPTRLSASACEALRACPYKFFALRVLGLREADELDDAVEKRDYGTWLHAVLHRFHATRSAAASPAEEDAQLRAIGEALRIEMRLDEASFLPYAASFARFVPRYLAWLRERDAQGAQWQDGERELSAQPAAWGGVAMHGVIDRIDRLAGDDGPVTQLIDYKTGSSQALRQQVKQPQEDTQLAFYAALMSQQPDTDAPITAVYLPLDDSEGIKAIEHERVLDTAEQLIEGIGRDLERLRQGAGMPALGEGVACEFCDARGVCRRDHWTAGAIE